DQGIDVIWLGTRRGLEARIVPAAGFDIEWLNVKGLVGTSWARKLSMPWMLLRAVSQALKIMRRRFPDVVLGMGGFAAGPGGIAAWLLRRPLVIHEANAVCGVTNRLLAPFSKRILTGFENVRHLGVKARWTGNPVRPEITPPVSTATDETQPFRLLVLGGSQGARSINERLPKALRQSQFGSQLMIRHQCGEGQDEQVRQAYTDSGISAQVVPFIDDMAWAYRNADLVIARSGAMTITELCAAGTASILLPFPHAASNHQVVNAQVLAHTGGAVVIEASALDQSRLALEIDNLVRDRSTLAQMGQAARSLARPDATTEVVNHCLELAHA
ncbi:MAG TPA: undecaprenyldiphospho-muramoylpentapeptide beta-N-acetylglucosaminyltransferase, partial [Gammaproteobacteria bacterium]|nr:undecaprenyldiphospho-muramoylpentapeptide beta-N-acetylglucosaminyltransferase [Gammaproteobacteria bacterium]